MKTQLGARFCSQIVLAAVVSVMLVRYRTFIPAKQIQSGTSNRSHRGDRTPGARTTATTPARQNPNSSPRISGGQSAKSGALANSPLELQSSAATRTRIRPRSLLGGRLGEGSRSLLRGLSEGHRHNRSFVCLSSNLSVKQSGGGRPRELGKSFSMRTFKHTRQRRRRRLTFLRRDAPAYFERCCFDD